MMRVLHRTFGIVFLVLLLGGCGGAKNEIGSDGFATQPTIAAAPNLTPSSSDDAESSEGNVTQELIKIASQIPAMMESARTVIVPPGEENGENDCVYLISESYIATPGQGRRISGTNDYFDESGNQLVDGVLGGDDPLADLGNGAGFEWVGWRTVDAVLTFYFREDAQVKAVEIGFSRLEELGINLPGQVVIGEEVFELAGDEVEDGKRGYVRFEGLFAGEELEIRLLHGAEDWILVDEVRFMR